MIAAYVGVHPQAIEMGKKNIQKMINLIPEEVQLAIFDTCKEEITANLQVQVNTFKDKIEEYNNA